LLSIKLNQPKLVEICGYKLATHWQNFMKILQKVLGGYFFDSHCRKIENTATQRSHYQ